MEDLLTADSNDGEEQGSVNNSNLSLCTRGLPHFEQKLESGSLVRKHLGHWLLWAGGENAMFDGISEEE